METLSSIVLIDWILFYVPSKEMLRVGEGLQYLGLYPALTAFEQRGTFIVPFVLWHGASVYTRGHMIIPLLRQSRGTKGVLKTYSNSDRRDLEARVEKEVHPPPPRLQYIASLYIDYSAN